MSDEGRGTARALEIVAEGRASHVQWRDHLRGCPGCAECRRLGIDWSVEREQEWIEKYDLVERVLQQAAQARAEGAAEAYEACAAWLLTEAAACRRTAASLTGEDAAMWVLDAQALERAAAAMRARAAGGGQ